jgi:hypothetical protein
MDAGNAAAQRRRVWCLLQLGREDEALAAAGALEQAPGAGALAREIAAAARELPSLDSEAAASRLAQLPVFTRAEAARLLAGVAAPEARTQRR